MRALLCLLVLFTLTACVNNVEKYYTGNGLSLSDPRITKYEGLAEIQAVSSENIVETMKSLMEDGYGYVGVSEFLGGAATKEHIQAVAKNLGASKVLYVKEFSHTEEGATPIFLPTEQTSYHSGTIDPFTTHSSTYSGTTTTYGTTTQWLKYSNRLYSQAALFFVPVKVTGLGIGVDKLSTEQRKATNSNLGVTVTLVMKDSPAFFANILRDDILISFADEKIKDKKQLEQLIRKSRGQKQIPITFWREGEVYTVFVDISA